MLFLARWARRLSWKETAEAFCTSWDKVFDAVEHVVTWGLEHRALGQIDAIGVDEIQYAKGHKYLTLVYQIDLGITRLLAIIRERIFLNIVRFGPIDGAAEFQTQVLEVALRDRICQKFVDDRLEIGQRADPWERRHIARSSPSA
jgi:hypothetical protein